TMAKNIQISLATRVQDASASFRKKQSAYLKSKRHYGHPHLNNHVLMSSALVELRGMGGMGSPAIGNRSSSPQPGSYIGPSLQESDADRSFSQSTLQASKQRMLQSNDAAIAQRE